jgi:formate-dependent nitrite reductase cytochrome c552 subunit
MANGDYDGDGAVEGFKSEIEGLMNTLASELHAAGLTDTVGVTAALTATNGDTSDLAIKLRKGGWNYTLVENDGSMGIHNPTYAVQILQQSILFLNQNALKSAAILRNDDLAVAKF